MSSWSVLALEPLGTVRFVLYEVYRDDAAVRSHFETPHFSAWREETAEWIIDSGGGHRFRLLDPDA